MCLSIPSEIVEIHEDASSVVVDTMGVKRTVSSHLMTETLLIGDYVLIHIGFIMEKIDTCAAKQSLEQYENLLDKMEIEGG